MFLVLQKCSVVDARYATFHLSGCLVSVGASGQSNPQYKHCVLKLKGATSERLYLLGVGAVLSGIDFVEQYRLTQDLW